MTHSCLELLFLATLEDLARGRSKTLAKTQGAQRNQDHPESFLLRSGGSWRPWRTWREDEARHSRSLRSEREALLQGVKAFGGLASLAISARGRSKALAKTQGAQGNQDHPESFLLRSCCSWRAWRSRRGKAEENSRKDAKTAESPSTPRGWKLLMASRGREEDSRGGGEIVEEPGAPQISYSCSESGVLGDLGDLGEMRKEDSRRVGLRMIKPRSLRVHRPRSCFGGVILGLRWLHQATLARGTVASERSLEREGPSGLRGLDITSPGVISV